MRKERYEDDETPMEIPEDAPLYFIGDAAPTEAGCPFCVGGNWSFSDEGWMKWRVLHDTEHCGSQAGRVMSSADLRAALEGER